jgi:hypothetical protein
MLEGFEGLPSNPGAAGLAWTLTLRPLRTRSYDLVAARSYEQALRNSGVERNCRRREARSPVIDVALSSRG